MGLLLTVVVHAANIQDRDGAKLVLEKARGRFPRLKLIWADGGYAGKLVDWVKQTSGWVLEQGHRIKILAKQEIFEETGVPGGFFSLLLQTGFRSVTLQQRGDKATYEAHVLGSMTVADATAVFAKHDIHHPV